MTGKPPFEIVKTTLGLTSIKDTNTGEILHNPVGPWAEANDLYVKQTNLASRLKNPDLISRPLVLFDVGLGAGFNAVAALHTFCQCQSQGPVRPLTLVSFETNMNIFAFGLENAAHFPFMKSFEKLTASLLKTGQAAQEGISWQLRQGPFEEKIHDEILSPEIIFFDPYSPKTNPEMWEFKGFKKLRELAQGAGTPAIFANYSVSTPIRVTLLLAGFFVGSGASSGAKIETTVASTDLKNLSQPLDLRWLERWSRSSTPHPLGLPMEPLEQLREKLLKHPQFAQWANFC